MEEIKAKIKFFVEEKIDEILSNYSNDEFDDILDERDEEYFSDLWMENFDAIKKISTEKSIDKSFSDKLREYVFKKVNDRTSNSDLASYISDDFGLLVDALEINYNDEWLNALWLEYKNNRIPMGVLNETEGDLKRLIE